MSALRGESSGVPETVRVLAVGAEGTVAAAEGVGCVPVVVPTADRAIEELADGRFDCLLIDASAPAGVESVERLREAAPTLPIVAFCGAGTAGAAIEAGATDVVRATPGSLPAAELEHEIRSALDRDGYGARHHEEIAALGRSALDGEGLPVLLERAVALVADALPVERCGVFEHRTDGEREGALSLREGVGWETTFEVEATDGSWAGHTLDAGEPVVVSDLGDETRFGADGGPLADHGVASGIGVAIGPPEDPWGMLGAYATRPRRFTATEVGFVRAVADVLAGSVERESLRDGFETDAEEVYGRVTDAFLALDADARVTHLNDRAEKLLGFPREELLGRVIWEPFPDAFEETFRDDYWEAMEHQEPIERERYYPFLDRWYEGRAYPSESGLSVYFRDITERKRAERELREERNLNERIVETSPIGITVIDGEGQLTFANERAEEIFGRSEELMLTHSHDDERWDVVDADGERVPADELPFARVKREEEPVFGERLGISRPDGGRVWISANCAPLFDDEGEFDGAVYSFEDVTEKRRLQGELEELLDRVTDAFYSLDDEWRFTYVNERAAELIDFTGEGLVGKHVWETFEWAADSTLREEYERAMETQEPASFELYYPDPLDTWFSVHAYPSESGLSVYFRDVTERKRIERELRESEQKFRTVAENLEEVVWMSTPEKDEMLYANPAYEEIWGCSREELYEEPLSFLESIHPEDRDRVREALPEQRHGTFEEEYRIVRPDGETRWIHSTAVPVQGEDGEVERIVGIADDITERREYEEYLRETKERLEAATEAGAVGTWEWRIPEDEMVTGTSFARTFGVDPDAASEGVSLDRFVDAIHPEDRDRVEHEIEEAVESCGEYEAEYRVRDAEGELRWVFARGHVESDGDGNPVRFPGALVDVTERKEHERELELFRTLLDRSSDAVFVSDPETGRILDANETATRHLGYSRDELLELTVLDLDTELPDREAWQSFVEDLREEGQLTFDGVQRRKDGTTFPVEVNVSYVELDREYVLAMSRDVTERKRMERELRESEQKFRTVAENLEEVVWMSTPEKDEMLYVNPAYEEVWGRTLESVYEEPRSFLDAIHPEDRDRVEEALADQVRGEYDEEYRVVRPDGETRWIHDHAVPVHDEDGVVERIVGIADDVTERKEREEYFREAKARLEAATEAGAVGTWEWRIPEDEMMTGASFARTFGIDPDAAREGVSLDRFVEAIHEDDRDRIEREVEEAVESCGEYEAEYRVWNAADELRWVFARGHVESDEEGNPVRFPGALVDITERKELERALREERDLIGRIVDTSPVGIVTLDADGSFDIVNERATEILGYPAEELEELAGDIEGFDPVKPDDEPFAEDEIPTHRVLVEGETFHDLEMGLQPPDRDRVWLSVSGTPLRDEDGATTGGVITFADITERKERERELERYREYTDEIVNAIDDVFYVIGEDGRQRRWNESLPAVTGYSEDELESMHALEFFDERHHDRIREAIEIGFETGHTRVEAPFLTADGESVFYEFDASTLTTPDGERVLAGIGRDVSERRAMEEALRERERQLSTLMENVPGMVYRCHNEQDWPMEFVSEGCRELAGYEPEALENGEMTWGDAILDEDRDELWEEIQTKVNEDEPFTATYRVRTADGDVRWVREDGRGVYEDGEIEALEGVITDVTERMRLERRLRENVETLQEFHRIVSATDTTFEEKVSALLELGRERLDLPYGFVTRIEDGVQTIVASEADHELLQPGESCPLSEAYCRRTIESDRLVDVHDVEAAGWDDEPAYDAFGYGSYVGGKVVVDGELYGTLCFASHESRGSFTDAERTFVELACDWVAQEIGRTEDQRALEQRMRQQHVVAELGQRALEADDLDAFFAETCEVVADVLDVEYCKVLDLDSGHEELLIRQGTGFDDGVVGTVTVGVSEETQAGYTLLSEEPIITEDLAEETRFTGHDVLRSHDVVSGITVVVGSVEEPWGVLGIHDVEHREFGEHDADFVQSVANVLANVIERDEHERELQRRREHLETLNQLNAVIRDISHSILETSSREEIETAVCERLADRYQFAWIGGLERGENAVSPRVAAGVEEGYLDEIEIRIDGDDPTSQGPTGRAIRDREPQFWSNVLENPEYEPWHDAARERGYRSSAAIPIQHEGALYGVLNVYSGDPDAFEGSERNILTHLGEIVGHTIYAVEQRKALVSDTVTELDFRMDGAGQRLIEATNGEGTISFERTVPTGGDVMLRFVTVSGIEPDRFFEAVEEYPWVEGATLLAERGDESLFELTTTDSPVTGTLASYGGRVRSATITDGELRVVAEVPPDADVRAVIEALEDAYPGTELLAQRTTTRGGTTRQELHAVLTDRLTDKQRAALETAYFAGYFDWPRTNTGEEVADLLGLSAATFTQHLRIAERKLFEALFADGSS